MAKLSINAGATSQTINIFIQDSSSTTGQGLANLVYNSAGLVASYGLPAAARVAISLNTQTVTGAWTTGGFVEIDATNMKGLYRFDIPNAAIASGRFSTIFFYGATNMAPLVLEIDLQANTYAIAGTAQTARDIGASVLLSAGTGTGQLDFTSGVVKGNVTQWLGTTVSTPTTAGVPNVNAKTWNDLATVALPLVPTTAGRTLDVSTGGEAGLDWANIGSPTTSNALTGTTIATTQKVDIETIKTNPVVNAGTVTFPTTATLASTTNITAGTITTVTNLTNAATSGDFTATMKTSIGTAVAASAVASVTGNVGGNVVGSVGSVTGNVGGNVTGNVSGNVTGSVGSVATGGITEASYSTTAGTFAPLQIVDRGTAQSATSTTLVLRAAAAFADSELVGETIVIRSATTGAGQSRIITAYVGSTDTATVDTWTTTPTGTILYDIFGTAKGSAATTPVDVTRWNGTAVASPATAGIPEVNIKNVNNVSTSSVTTVSANQGTTQPINFTGTGASALAKSDMVDIAGAAVSATTAQIGTNVVNWNNTVVATPATAGIPDINVKNMNNVAATSITTVNANQGTTQPINFTGTAGSALAKSDMVDIAGAAVSTSTAQIGTNSVNWAGGAIPAPNVTGVPLVDDKYLLGTVYTTPATAGIQDVNVKNIDNDTASASGTVTFPNATLASTSNIASGTITTVTGNVGGNVGGNVTGSVGSIAAGGLSRSSINSDTGLQSIRSNTAQAGAATSLTLDTGASATNSFYVNDLLVLTSGTGAGQARFITGYVGATKVATVATWITTPDATTTFAILPFDSVPGATAPTAVQVATAVWQDTTATDFTTANSVGKSVMNGVALGTGLTIASVSGAVGSVTGAVGSVTGNVGGNVTGTVASVVGNVGGNVTGSVGSVASGGITRASLAADTGLQSIRSNTAQAGAATTITLDAAANATNNFYNNTLLLITGGTGAGQARFITAYVGATKVATVATWVTNPDNTSTFAILPFDSVAGASAPTAAQVATAVWTDLLASTDFSTATSIGKLLKDDVDAAISTRLATSGYTTPPTSTENADALLKRDWTAVTGEAARSVLNALRAIRNKFAVSAGTLSVYKEDDSTVAWQGAVTSDSAAEPITEVDPT